MVAAFLCMGTGVRAALPPDFPQLSIQRTTNPAPGYLFGNLAVNHAPGYSNYFAILDNDGSPILLNQTTTLGELACNGLFVSAEGKGQSTRFLFKDAAFNVIGTNQAGNGYSADPHVFQLLPNGHALILIADSTPVIDMSQIVPGGFPAAQLTQAIIQEVDGDGRVVFEWRSLDHVPVTDSYRDLTVANLGDYIRVNALCFDETDGNLILSCRNTSEIIKISRVTGEVIWRLQGKHNQFSFTNAIPGNSDPPSFQAQSHACRLPNGNLMVYDNGYSRDWDPAYSSNRPYSRVVEYVIDEARKSAGLVWQFRHSPDIIGYSGGIAERLAGGHTIIHWGRDSTASPALAMTEVDVAGRMVCEVALPQPGVSGKLTRILWPLESSYVTVTKRELAAGNSYGFNSGGTNVTGVAMDVSGIAGELYNSVTVSVQPFAPVLPRFLEKAPRVLKVRVEISPEWIEEITAVISFDVHRFGFADPANTTVYYRPTPGQGVFVALPTQYNWFTDQLEAYVVGLGEFIFGFPDLAEVPYPPLLFKPPSNAALNQELPVSLAWTPKGFARSYALQIATDARFATLAVDIPLQIAARYTFTNAHPNTTYYWRVNTSNDGGVSDWATNVFRTLPPAVQVTAPNGGENWQRGHQYLIQWKDNIAENVVIDLYKRGAFTSSIATNASTAYAWTAGLDLPAGSDYTIKVSSQTNGALYDSSDRPFSLDAMTVPVSVATTPAGLNVTVDDTNYATPVVFNWIAGSSHTLDVPSPQPGADGGSRYLFTAWNDGSAQRHAITVPGSSTNFTAGFATQFLLTTTVTPAGAATISNYPAGPWYGYGETVELTARTNAGYRLGSWQGVDSESGARAEVVINGYRAVQVGFVESTYPYITVTNSGASAPGHWIGNIGGRNADGTRSTYVVLDNTGTNVVYSSTSNIILRFGTPQGYIVDNTTGFASFRFKDETLTNVAETVTTPGYVLDAHDLKLLPNGHSLLIGTEVRTVDMSEVVPNGKAAAAVTGNVIQELDGDQRLVFEWHTFDHIPITNTFADVTQPSFDYAHINAITLDPTDNHLLASLRTTSEILKINRRTGQVMWRLGGKMNQFTFVNEHEENAPFYTVGQHDAHRLANGNLLFFDNGNIAGGGVTPNDRSYSRVVEYALDETRMTATLVWEYRHTPDIQAPCTGSVKRMGNGNTLVDWGCGVATSGYIVTEVDAEAQVVFEMRHRTNSGLSSVMLGGGLTKQPWNSPDLIRTVTFEGIQAGRTYDASAAGVAVTVTRLSGEPDNILVVQRLLDAPRQATFAGKSPQVTLEHVVLSGSNIASPEFVLELDLPETSYVFDAPVIHDPSQVMVYHRPSPGQGQFAPLPASYESGSRKLRVTLSQWGELIYGYPDVDETPLVPTILSPKDQSGVNQAAPVTLIWVPQGLVGSFDLQLASDAGFANLLLSTHGLRTANFSLTNPAPDTQYYWRVRTVNQGGVSDWASASFTTVPPMLQVTYPAGGEVWQRFQVVNIRWADNLPENVAVQLYKGGVSNRTFVASTPSSGSYQWTVGQFAAIPPGSDYTVKISSTLNPALFDFSEPFSIVQPVTLATVPRGLTVTVDGTNYASPATFAWVPDSSHRIGTASPQVAGDGRTRYLFDTWSDGGAESHSITAPLAGATITAKFSTNYLLDIIVTPSAAATVAALPAGPWYAPGQLVSLSAQPDADYLLYTWEGVDTQMSNTAQLAMSGYRAVEAKLIPPSGLPAIQTDSMATLPDGRVQFTLRAGAGLAARATIWGAARLTPPDWKVLATVVLTNGQAVFTDSTAPAEGTRFYRVSLP